MFAVSHLAKPERMGCGTATDPIPDHELGWLMDQLATPAFNCSWEDRQD